MLKIHRIFSNVVEGFFIPYRIISLVLQKSGNLKSQIEITKKSTYLIGSNKEDRCDLQFPGFQ